MKKMMILLGAALLALPAMAGTIQLVPSANPVTLDSLFNVVVRYTGNVDEVVGFGFDVTTNGNLSYQGATILSPFLEAGAAGVQVSGLAFPGPTTSNVDLALLTFRAIGLGTGSINVSGINSDNNQDAGLFLLSLPTENIYSNGTVRIVAGESSEIPEPSAAWLVLSAIPAAWALRRRA